MGTDGFYLGGTPGDDRTTVTYDGNDLTTHGVIVGMTGSGKTGLGVIFLEEALRNDIPCLVIDPKGDMTNLLLTFPELAPTDFEPWVDEGEARREGKSKSELAGEVAALWQRGLGSWDLGGDDIAGLRSKAGFTIYTPGSEAGIPVNIVGSLDAPDLDFAEEAETLRDEIAGYVSGVLGLIGIDADPISSREHILLSNLIERAWTVGENLDLETLIGQIHRPPMRKLGVFDIDTFFPEKDRLGLAMALNSLIASPAFAAWSKGVPLDIGDLLWDDDGRPQAAIVYLAHLSEDERQFIVTLLMSKVVTWMRSQSGSSDLRALVYMDEVFGYVPPTAAPPSKKPILTMLKQARAFGVGMLLSTQNPVDLDYKAMSNAGTWCIGRLQTERDKARILEALQSATGEADVGSLDKAISALDKRQFVLHNTRDREPTLFGTRWAMSYLRGPMTREEVERITAQEVDRPEIPEPTPAAKATSVLADDESIVVPEVARGVPVRVMDPGAPWADAVGASPTAKRYEAALAARVNLIFDEAKADLRVAEEWEAIIHPLTDPIDPARAVAVDYDIRDFVDELPEDAVYALPNAPIDTSPWFTAAKKAIADHLYRNRDVEIFHNDELDLWSRPGETRQDFAARCKAAAEDRADEEMAKIRDRYESKMDTIRRQIDEAARRADEIRVDIDTRKREELMSGAGGLIGVLFGGRSSSSSVSTAARRRGMVRKAEQRLVTAEAKIAGKVEDLDELEDELADEVIEIDDKWTAVAEDIEVVEVGLEKSDISLAEIALVWIPVD